MIWYYVAFCVFVFVTTLWVALREDDNITWGNLVKISVGSVTPVANIVVLILALWLLGYNIWDKEVFK